MKRAPVVASWSAVTVALLLIAGPACAQHIPQAARIVELSLTTPSEPSQDPTGKTASRTESSEALQGVTSLTAQVMSTRPVNSRRRAPRTVQYSEDHLVIIGLDENSKEISRRAMIDPRLIRADAWHLGDDQPSQKTYRPSVRFSVEIAEPDVVKVQILKPHWDGENWSFATLSEATIE